MNSDTKPKRPHRDREIARERKAGAKRKHERKEREERPITAQPIGWPDLGVPGTYRRRVTQR